VSECVCVWCVSVCVQCVRVRECACWCVHDRCDRGVSVCVCGV